MKKILIIEDEKETRHILVEALIEEGFEVIGAKNGKEGIEKARKNYPNLIICDVNMSEINGYQVLTYLRQIPTFAIIPFIFISAFSDETKRHEAIKMGANDYLSKPFTVEQLLEVIAIFTDPIDE